MNARTLLGFLAICFTVAVTTLSAQDAPPGRKLAVVVGNNKYRANQGLEDLKQAVNDATKLSEVLRGAGFKVAEMTHDVARQAGKEDFAPNADYIRDQIDNVIETPNLGRDDVVFISLHGHGVQFNFEETVVTNGKEEVKKTAKFYFCPADAAVLGVTQANDLTERNHLIPLDELYKKLEGCSAATKLLIVDACRNDPSRIENARNLESLTRPQLPPPPGGIAAFFSCKANQRALEDPDLQQGVFTHFLIQGLQGKADQPLENKPADGIVTLSELTSYVSNNTYSYVQDKYQGRRQSPDIKGEFDTTLPLIRLPKEKPLEKKVTSSVATTSKPIPMAAPAFHQPLFNQKVKSIKGEVVDLSKYKGKVLLIVNVASQCGLTPQYVQLEELNDKYAHRGLAVLGFPCNQFAQQEPGTEDDILKFCKNTYDISFDMFAKVEVNGDNASPLYKYLTLRETNPKFSGDIKWNFEKFLIGRNGEIIARFPSRIQPDAPEIVKAIEAELDKSAK